MSIDVLAADIGGTNLRVAHIRDGLIIQESHHQADFSLLNHLNTVEVEHHILDILEEAVQPLLNNKVKGLGIGFPGFFIGNSGVLAASPNIPQLKNFALGKRLSQRLNIPVTAQNDALCAAIGEQCFGAGKGHANLLHITLGTGIGGGLILNNAPYTGESGMAMEFGHLRVAYDQDARLCGCGNHGCVEAYASASAISSLYAEATDTHLSAKQVYQRARDNDSKALALLESSGTYLGQAIAESIKLLDIRHITISGGLIGAWEFLYPALMVSLNINLIPPLKGKISVTRSALDDQAGLLGAASLALNLKG